jgi:hypothetical protein
MLFFKNKIKYHRGIKIFSSHQVVFVTNVCVDEGGLERLKG